MTLPDPANPEIERILLTGDEIAGRLDALAKEISADYEDKDLVVAAVLKGAFVLLADFARRLTIPCTFDFMAVSSYGSATKTSGVVRILKDLDVDIAGRHVLVVEDIVDSGLTLQYLLRNLRVRRPASVEVMALLVKSDHVRVDLPIAYRGFDIGNEFVVGYGLDYAERFRNLPYIGTLRPEAYRS